MSKLFFSNTEKNNYAKLYIEKKLSQYGKMNYVYSVMNKRNTDEMAIISDLPETLVVDYLNNKKQNIDPVILAALNRITSFSWDDNIQINSQWTVKKLFDPVKPYNINSGYAFVLHDHYSNLAVLSLYIDKYMMSEVEETIKNHKDELQGLLLQAHSMLLDLYHDQTPNQKFTLSSRESDILYWCSTGKTYQEVSDILKITVSTVKFHMSKVVKKMGVKNAKHAISLSVELGLASPPNNDKI
ncbi:helix-turn-helix transcriptional regulator [Enterobacter bugandensis]|uniref:helix-turn-helix transcriptional regulator n=1 Tax=Enterobacter bugandensis TaxID=881260 RepID=UPI0023610153|nr:LuxR family transcriptional regulator [Enterobacter bugandensis]